MSYQPGFKFGGSEFACPYILWLLRWMLPTFGGSCGAGGLDADHLSVPARCPRAWTRGCDWGCTGRRAGWGLRRRTGHVLRRQRNIHMVWKNSKTWKCLIVLIKQQPK